MIDGNGRFIKGDTPWNKGKKHSEETRKRISISKTGHKFSQQIKENMKITNKGKLLGYKHTDESKLKISLSKKGRKLSKETKNKIGLGNKGEKCHLWKGGISVYKYGIDWTDDLRDSIRKRDNFICKECGIHQDELNGRLKKLDIHHIDYDKYNLNPNNLICLCRSCHAKTNINREYWINYFKKYAC